MKQLLALILLISHINFSMFIAQVDEIDSFDRNGHQLADINSLVQFISFSVDAGRQNDYRDSDDDNARYFHIERPANLLFVQDLILLKKSTGGGPGATTYPDLPPERTVSSLSEIFTPPPETLAV